MQKEQVKVGDKVFEVHELLAIEFDKVQEIEDSTKRIVELIKKSANLTDEEYNNITLRERTKLTESMNRVNGWSDFQKSEIEEEESTTK